MGSLPALVVAACVSLPAFELMVQTWGGPNSPLRVQRLLREDVELGPALYLYEACHLTHVFWEDVVSAHALVVPLLHVATYAETWRANASAIATWTEANVTFDDDDARLCARLRLKALLGDWRDLADDYLDELNDTDGTYRAIIRDLPNENTLVVYLNGVTRILEANAGDSTDETLYYSGLDNYNVPFLLACRMPWIHHMRLLMYTLDKVDEAMTSEETRAWHTLLGAFWTREEIIRRVALPAHLEEHHLGSIHGAMVMALRLCLERFVDAHPMADDADDADDGDEDL